MVPDGFRVTISVRDSGVGDEVGEEFEVVWYCEGGVNRGECS